jgi:O-antigen/teichoic acid export membrane protein
VRKRFETLFADRDASEVLHKAVSAFALKGVAAVAALILNVLVARALGAEGMGAYALALTVVTVLATVSRFGFDLTLVRHVSAAMAVQAPGLAVAGMRLATRVVLIASATIAMLLLLGAEPFNRLTFAVEGFPDALRLAAPGVVFIAFSILYASALKGLRLTVQQLLVRSVVQPVAAASIFGIAWWSGAGHGPGTAVVAYVSGALAAASLGWWWWRRAAGAVAIGDVRVPYRALLGTAVSMMWITVFQQVMNWVAIVATGIWSTAREVGLLHAGQRTAMLISFVLVASNAIAAPKFAEFFRTNDRERLRRTIWATSWLTVLLGLPIAAPMLLAPGFVLSMFGAEFAAGDAVLAVLALGHLVNVLTGSVTTMLVMSGKERLVQWNTTAAAVLNVALTVFLTPRYGAFGAAMAMAVALSVQNVAAAILVYRNFGLLTIPGMAGRSRRDE